MSRSDRLIICIGNLEIGVEGVNPTICFKGGGFSIVNFDNTYGDKGIAEDVMEGALL